MNSAPPVVEPLRGISPRDAFLALRTLPLAVWLDSVVPQPRGRFSMLAADPVLTLSAKGDAVTQRSGPDQRTIRADPFAVLGERLRKAPAPSSLPIPCPPGAAIGYFGYELKNQLERLPARALDDLGLPDMFFGVYDVLFAFDHEGNEAWLVSSGLTSQGNCDATQAKQRAAQFLRLVAAPESKQTSSAQSCPVARARGHFSEPKSNFTRAEYLAAVQRAKDYIAQGDVYQINLSQRFESTADTPLDTDAQNALYLRLRESNPAPFAAFLDIGDAAILSSSPECFLDITDRTVRTFPIKGTRRRGVTPAEDACLAAELLASRKDNAELVMIVDLERNDLGRVCEYGSVCVPELARVESYATVHHLVATVEGKLRPHISHLDCVRACFPGGSITGTPKIHAMEIIDELEPHTRGVYTGAIGMIGLPDAEGRQRTALNIAIRTMTVTGNRVLFHSGGGIVADSQPEAEYDETLHKARGMMEALL